MTDYFYHHPETNDLWSQNFREQDGTATYLNEISLHEFGQIHLDTRGTLPEELVCDYQYRIADFICEHPYCAAWVDMGLGKSMSTLMALQRLIDDFESAHILIVGPLRVARKVWTDEMQIWDHVRDFEVQKIIGTVAERTKAMNTPAEIHLINRENVAWLYEQMVEDKRWRKKWHWDTVIIDESSSFSYQSSQRWKKISAMRGKMDRIVQLTGTPDTRSLLGLWAQIHLLDKGERLGFSEGEFQKKWFIAPNRHQVGNVYTPRHYARKQIVRRISDIVISLRAEDYLDVKRPQFNYVRVDMTKGERKLYRELEKQHILRFGDDIVRAVNSGVLANKLLQISNGFVYTEHPEHKILHNHKIDALLELLQGLTGPVMLAYNYIPDRERIIRALKKHRINFRLLKTEQDEDDWNAGKIDVLLFHPKSAGHGCNIHKSGTTNLVFFGLLWSLEQYEQVIARLVGGHRAGGRDNVIHIIVTQGTYEDRVRYTLTKHGRGQKDTRAQLAKIQEMMAKDLMLYARAI